MLRYMGKNMIICIDVFVCNGTACQFYTAALLHWMELIEYLNNHL
jgi:hypothetical protein